jgi:hypothetical protein
VALRVQRDAGARKIGAPIHRHPLDPCSAVCRIGARRRRNGSLPTSCPTWRNRWP